MLRGIPVSPGVRHGKIVVLGRSHEEHVPKVEVPADGVAHQVQRLEQALLETRQDLLEMHRQVSAALGDRDASVFEAHLLVLDDPTLLEEVHRILNEEKVTAEYAYQEAVKQYLKALSEIEDDYLRERAADVRDVSARVLNKLLGRSEPSSLRQIQEPCILISYDLSPSDTAQLDTTKVLGFGTDIGSQTSHTAIMARALGIPAVVGLQTASQELTTGQYALLDGFNGLIIVNPSDQTLFKYGELVRKQETLTEKLRELRDKPAITLDGARIILSANVEVPSEVDAVITSGAEGVGLFRTEFFFLNRNTVPDEEEQYRAYREVAAALKPQPVVIRTLDLGGDKFLSHLQALQEINPFLGWRAIRFCLQQPELFRAQLRAILRASAEGNVKMMYPMVSCQEELAEANALVEKYKDELRQEGVPFDENLEIGAMVEIPSAALAADSLAQHVKFFSIGTNDLIQYALAIDRANEKVAHLYQPTHPAIVRLIKMTVEAAHRHGLWVGICGEMAGDVVLVPLLLGLGVDELSVAPLNVPRVKYLIRRVKIEETRRLAEEALRMDSSADILAKCQDYVRGVAPALLETLSV